MLWYKCWIVANVINKRLNQRVWSTCKYSLGWFRLEGSGNQLKHTNVLFRFIAMAYTDTCVPVLEKKSSVSDSIIYTQYYFRELHVLADRSLYQIF